MKIIFNLKLLLIILFILSCSKKEEIVKILEEKNLETQMIEVYNEAMEELKEGMLYMLEKNLVKQNFCIHNRYGPLEQY